VWGEAEEVRGAVELGRVDGEGMWEGVWCMDGFFGLSLGAKPGELPIAAGALPSKSKKQVWRQRYDISTWHNFKSTFNSETERVVEIFWKQHF
jgi:hypothetical protein